MKIVHFLCLALLPYASLASVTSEKLSIQQIMSEAEMKQIGLDNLTPEQEQAFERWVATWTKRVIEQAPSYRPGENITTWIQRWPTYANPAKTEFSEEDFDSRQRLNQKVDKIRNDGEFVELKDGSIWQVSPVFRYLTTTWQRDQTIEIKKSDNVRHPYVLHNIDNEQVVQADLKQPPSPSGQKKSESAEYYQGSFTLSSTSEQGDVLYLDNGSAWKVAPMDMYRSRNWKVNDRIKVQKGDNILYQYRLQNLDTGEIALANKHQ
jgi:hypothetical protein